MDIGFGLYPVSVGLEVHLEGEVDVFSGVHLVPGKGPWNPLSLNRCSENHEN